MGSASGPAPTKETAQPPPADLNLEDVVDWLTANPPEFVDVRDDLWCTNLTGSTRANLKAMAEVFLKGKNIYADERTSWGPPKWTYSDDPYDSFDYYSRNGCPNCGAEFDFRFPFVFETTVPEAPTLTCSECGLRLAPFHYDVESDSFVDRMVDKQPTEGCVYIRGTRKIHNFGQNTKIWWQSYYLPKSFRMEGLKATLDTHNLLSKMKAPKVQELCEVCGNDEAFYTSYQARAADEGSTVMYECTKCKARKTFNN